MSVDDMKRMGMMWWIWGVVLITPVWGAEDHWAETKSVRVVSAQLRPLDELLKIGVRYDPGRSPQGEFDWEADILQVMRDALSLKPSELWVNLSPNQPDRICSDSLCSTYLGDVMLNADLQLKRISAQLCHPQTETGSALWNLLRPHQTDTSDGFGFKVWIQPDQVDVWLRASAMRVDIHQATLTASLEFLREGDDDSSAQSLTAVNDLLLPQLQNHLAHNPVFNPLQSAFRSLILARAVSQMPAYRQWNPSPPTHSEFHRAANRLRHDVYQNYLALIEDQNAIVLELYDADSQRLKTVTPATGGVNFQSMGWQAQSRGISSHRRPQSGMVKATLEPMGFDVRHITSDEWDDRLRSTRPHADAKWILLQRDDQGRLMPVWSDSVEFESLRPLSDEQWKPRRRMETVPAEWIVSPSDPGSLTMQTPVVTDWVPDVIKNRLLQGQTLVTRQAADVQAEGDWALLMPTSPDESPERSGRTGVVLFQKRPVIVAVNGEEFVLEAKGVGTYDYGFDGFSGRATIREASEEFNRLWNRFEHNIRSPQSSFQDVMPAAWTAYGEQWGLLMRFTPSTRRTSYVIETLTIDGISGRMFGLGRAIGELFLDGYLLESHPENFLVVHEDVITGTDYFDVHPIRDYPRTLDGKTTGIQEGILATLLIAVQMPGYEQQPQIFVHDFIDGLSQAFDQSKVVNRDLIHAIRSLKNYPQLSQLLYQKLFFDYYHYISSQSPSQEVMSLKEYYQHRQTVGGVNWKDLTIHSNSSDQNNRGYDLTNERGLKVMILRL
jgi:hypothetical protein